jgi:hypothetical protein
MHLEHTTTGGTLTDPDNFRQLDVRISASTDEKVVQEWLEELGATPEVDHVWVPLGVLRDLGRPADAEWRRQFDAMIDYADGAGWVRAANGVRQVRAHRTAG